MIKTIKPTDLADRMAQKTVFLIDVREIEEYEALHIEEAFLMPLSTFNITDLPQTHQPLVIHCRSGARSAHVGSVILASHPSMEVYNLEGGILAWAKEGFPCRP